MFTSLKSPKISSKDCTVGSGVCDIGLFCPLDSLLVWELFEISGLSRRRRGGNCFLLHSCLGGLLAASPLEWFIAPRCWVVMTMIIPLLVGAFSCKIVKGDSLKGSGV